MVLHRCGQAAAEVRAGRISISDSRLYTCSYAQLLVLADSRTQVTAVISSPLSGVSAVTAEGVLCAFCCVLDALPGQCLRWRPVQVPFSLLFLELSGYCVNAARLHVYAADVLVRCDVDGDGSR